LRSLVKRDLQNVGPFDPILKAFAMNVNFYSNSAYNGLRSALHNILPHAGTIKRWYKGIDGSPGFTRESLNAINRRCLESKMSNRPVVALSMDEVAIRKHVEWDPVKQKMMGYVSFISGTDGDDIASKALVFMATCVNSSWKVPLGYFYVNGFDANKRTKLLKECLKFMHDGSTAEICSLTFDGDAANVKMVENMGAKINDDDLCAAFINPFTDKPIQVILDMCHMVKLVRNNLEKKKVIYFRNEKIEWR
jgi:hypothetical protein